MGNLKKVENLSKSYKEEWPYTPNMVEKRWQRGKRMKYQIGSLLPLTFNHWVGIGVFALR